MQTVFPILRYNDARAAIRWLCDALGFELLFSVPESGPVVRHAQLTLGPNLIMVGSVRPADGLSSPAVLGSASQALCIHVDEVDAAFHRILGAGGPVPSSPVVSDIGFLEFHVLDPEGHPWVVSSFPNTAR